jgi:hypothetical protein
MTARTVKGPDGLNKSGNGRGVGLATKIPRGKRTGGAPKTNYTALEARSRGFSTATISGASLVDPNKPLTEMQKEFVKHWASGETILSASVKAGYADGGTFAYRLCRMPNIIKLYNREKEKYEEAAQMSRKKVMDMLLESYEAGKDQARGVDRRKSGGGAPEQHERSGPPCLHRRKRPPDPVASPGAART